MTTLAQELGKLFHRALPQLSFESNVEEAHSSESVARQVGEAIRGRTAIVLDNSNILKARLECDHGYPIDFGIQGQFYLGGDTLVAADAVVTNPPSKSAQYDGQRNFYKWLQDVGWRVHGHLIICNPDPSKTRGVAYHEDERAVDGCCRALIRQHMVRDDIDTIVLLSGDGGMTNAVREARAHEKTVVVLSWAHAFHPTLADAATHRFHLEDLRQLLNKRQH